MTDRRVTRRQMLGRAGAVVSASIAGPALARESRASAQPASDAQPPRLAPPEDLVNILEFEEQAKKTLANSRYQLIAGGERAMFDRVTLRPRMLVPTVDMDLAVTIAGHTHFAPILVAPVADQARFHPSGELETATGAAAAKAVMVVSSRPSVPIDRIASQTRSPLWCQAYASDPDANGQIRRAIRSGVAAVVITVGAVPAASGAQAPATPVPIDWAAVDVARRGVDVPVLIKGITTVQQARTALRHDVQGLIVSNHGGLAPRKDALILTLPDIVDAVAGNAAVLIDGSFRRGTDILKALAFGARGVLVGRPVMWGLAAYGAQGVQGVLEMLQTELARYMGMCGKSHVDMLDRSVVRVHGVRPKRAGARA